MTVYIKLEKHDYTYKGVTDIQGDSTILSIDWHIEDEDEELITSTSGFDCFWVEDIIELRITENEPQEMPQV